MHNRTLRSLILSPQSLGSTILKGHLHRVPGTLLGAGDLMTEETQSQLWWDLWDTSRPGRQIVKKETMRSFQVSKSWQGSQVCWWAELVGGGLSGNQRFELSLWGGNAGDRNCPGRSPDG